MDYPKPNTDALVATLADLVSINSVNPQFAGGPGEGKLAEYVADFFRQASIPCVLEPVFAGRPNVIATLEGKSRDRRLVMEAHMDTASELGMSIAPFTPDIRGGRLYGRGSCDTKGGLAAMMHAFKAVRDAGIQPPATPVLVAAVDEEYGFQGAARHLENGATADGAVVAEPTELAVVVASKGVLRWRVQVRGRAAHTSKPHLGVNAITKMSRFIVAVEEKLAPVYRTRLHPLLGAPTITVGTIHGGIQVNQVPESCVVEIDRRMLPGEDQQTVWREVEEVISGLAAADPDLKLEMEPPRLVDLALETPESARIVEVARKVSQEVRGDGRLVGVPYGSDASKFSRAGIPSIILGPGNIDLAHAAEEYVELEQVIQAAEIYTRILMEF